jgi:Zn-dependent protease
MRDPINWSIPLGRVFGINIRIHILFPIVALGLILRAAYRKSPAPPEGAWIDETIIMGLLFGSVLLHEFGHCFGARAVNGDASDVLIWPLGGLASVDVPHTPRANFITTAAGPLVNVILCLICFTLLFFVASEQLQPPWNPVGVPGRDYTGQVTLTTWAGAEKAFSPYSAPVFLVRLFWVNWVLFLFNVVLIGFPLDGGRLFQAVLWNYVGYRQATLAAVFAGFVTMFIVGLWGIVADEMMALCLAAFIYFACKHQWLVLETGGDESVFGYDFSQGYTSLERDEQPTPRPATRKLNWWQRWLQRRAARKMQREMEDREADERRMDQLLEKISTQGMGSLTEEEKRFMKHFSDRYKNRHS